MQSFNKASIVAKAEKFMNRNEGKKKAKTVVDQTLQGGPVLENSNLHSLDEIGDTFIRVLTQAIQCSGLYTNEIEAVSGWQYNIYVPRHGNGNCEIWIYKGENDHRPSLYEEGYPGGIDSIVNLLNYGALGGRPMRDHVYGEWRGWKIASRTVISGVHFLEQAKTDFMSNYAAEYNVISCEIAH